MIVVDTSVWVDALRATDPRLATELGRLLDEGQVALAVPVKIELLSGASRRDALRLQRTLSALPLLAPGAETWTRMETWALESGSQRPGLLAALGARPNPTQPLLYTSENRRVPRRLSEVVDQGDRFGVGDLLVAALAAENEAAVWSLDGDFARMAARGWIRCWQPRD